MDAELRRYRVDLHSLAIGFPEPAPAHRFEKEYYEDFGSEVPFRKFGYMSLAAFLDDHPDLQQVILYGQKTYRAKISAATADIQSLVSRQKSNKKGKNGKQRFRAPVMKLQPRMLPPPPIRPMKPQNAVQKTVQPVKEEPLTGSPAERAHRGMQRILEALNRCCGMATLTKLNAAYQLLYGTQMNRKEMIAHFGTVNFRTIHETWLSNEIEMTSGPSEDWIFVTKEALRKQKEWEEKHKDAIVTHDGRIAWDKPTIKELFDKVVAMVVNMYPTPLPISAMSETYKRAHGVQVDPETLYSKSWEELVKTTFAEKVQLKKGEVSLTPKALQEFRQAIADRQKPIASSSHSNVVKRVTADDLGLEYSDESDEFDNDEDEPEGKRAGDAGSDISSIQFSPVVSSQDSLSNTSASGPPPSIKEPFHGKEKYTDFGRSRTSDNHYAPTAASQQKSTACDTTHSSVVSQQQTGRVLRMAPVKVMSASEFNSMMRERNAQNKENNHYNHYNYNHYQNNNRFSGGRQTRQVSMRHQSPPPRRSFVPPVAPPPRPAPVAVQPRIIPAVERGLPQHQKGSIFSRISFNGTQGSSPKHNNASPKKATVWTPEKAQNKANQRDYRVDTRAANQMIQRALRESPVKQSPQKASPQQSPLKVTIGATQERRVSLSPVPEQDFNGNKAAPRFSFLRRGSGFGAKMSNEAEKEAN